MFKAVQIDCCKPLRQTGVTSFDNQIVVNVLGYGIILIIYSANMYFGNVVKKKTGKM